MTTNIDDKDMAWALKTFRPLLKALKLQEVKSEPLTVFPSQYKTFHRHNMTNCVIVVKTKEFTNKDDRGIFIWQYDEKSDFYALRIVLNSILFTSSDIDNENKTKDHRRARVHALRRRNDDILKASIKSPDSENTGKNGSAVSFA